MPFRIIENQETMSEGEGNTGRTVDVAAKAGEEPQRPRSDSSGNASKIGGIPLRILNVAMIAVISVVAIVFLQAGQRIDASYNDFATATDRYVRCERAANQMLEGSHYLTSQCRLYAFTQNPTYLYNYFEEAVVTRSREDAVAVLEADTLGDVSHDYLDQSLTYSIQLMDYEYYAMRLVVEATGIEVGGNADILNSIELSAEDEALTDQEKVARARDILFGTTYQDFVVLIEDNVASCKDALISDISAERGASRSWLDRLLAFQRASTWVLLILVVLMIVSFIALILWPIRAHIQRMAENKSLSVVGAREIRVMAKEYNTLYEDNLKHNDQLRRKAEHDHMTSLLNRAVFEQLLHAYRDDPIALLLIDVDYFKDVNDTHGHDVGDAVLRKVSDLLTSTFRMTDYPCRIGGDEFAVIMTDMTPDLHPIVSSKLAVLADGMRDTSDGLPKTTLSVGVAFNDEEHDPQALFKHADEALYAVKEAGRDSCGFYQPDRG